MTSLKLFAVAALVVLAALGITAAATAQSDDGEKIVLTVGLNDDVDTFNPITGVEVPDYDAWNLNYATLTDKAADDFATIPGLAESWEASNDGKTYTYTLREGLEWSDGTPLTAEDVVWNITRARDEEWLNQYTTVQNLTAKAIDERTVEITSSVPDPKLPAIDLYLLPKHVWDKYSADEITKHDGLDGVGSGPFILTEHEPGQFWRHVANDTYWAGRPKYDEIVFRIFNNADAMVAALEKGEIDAAFDIPSASYEGLSQTEGIVAVQGQQGNVDEIAINGGDGLKKPHPALLDLRVRQAIGHAIDKQTIIDQVYSGIGAPALTFSPSPDTSWLADIPVAEQYTFDLAKANQILDDAGYADTDNDGVREMPGGGDPLNFVFAVRTDSQVAKPIADFAKGWLEDIGIAVTYELMNESKLTEVIGKGDYDLFHWSWTPFVDPDFMLSVFQCNQIASDPADPTNYYNDANWCDAEYDKLYEQQKVELDPAKRREIVHEMLTRFYKDAVYVNLVQNPDLEAYRTDRFEGWLRQPAEVGPVIFTNTSPTYFNLTPIEGGGSESGMSSAAIGALVVAGLIALGAIGFMLMRRRTAGERE
ncbi:MAG TPA: ABC transporter substrate-binding protein [Gaiellaceae bacterium]|nr:ABC transporter substrate-binding protein [Gaiellaceae bacterium]